MIHAHWCISDNFGDKLTPWLIEKITGSVPVWTPLDDPTPKYLISGSILNWANSNCIVWGAGLARVSDALTPATEGTPCMEVHAVRGPLTKFICDGWTIPCPEVYGDPALLLPRFITTRAAPTHEVGLVPHYADQAFVNRHYGGMDKVKIINVLANIEDVVRDIRECERILSSSLHGLIVADAWNIPSAWCQFSDRVLGDGMKFIDHMLTMNRRIYSPIQLRSGMDNPLEAMLGSKYVEHKGFDELWDACPLR